MSGVGATSGVGLAAAVAAGRPVVVGLAGGIASGKSSVCGQLAALGAATIDADKLGHALYTPGHPVAAAVGEAFNAATADGGVDRAILGAAVFGSKDAMTKLTDLVWPPLLESIQDEVAKVAATAVVPDGAAVPVTVVEAAVLIEAGWHTAVDEVWVLSVPRDEARARIMARNGLSAEDADKRIDSQMSNEERTSYADRVIDTTGPLEDQPRVVKAVWDALQADAAALAASQ